MTHQTSYLAQQMTEWRHAFHRQPELGFAEHATSARVGDLLESFGCDVHRKIGQTGVVGVLKRGTGERTIALRADMDALPITETNAFAHKSEIDGVMHACGHDGHTTMLLGAASYLAEHGSFEGRVVFIFQPNEENGYGALAMIDDGLIERFEIDEVHGLHNMPGMEIGTFATRPGPITASESLFEISIMARGGHSALPHMGADAITIGAELVTALQTIVSRKLDPAQNGVVSVTEFIADGTKNVLPGTAQIKGDARALTPQTTEAIERHMRQIVDGICAAHGVQGDVTFETGFRPTLNAPDAVRAATAAASRIGDTDGDCQPKLFSEDFASLAASCPGCFILMGNGTEGAHARPLHSADYDFNDAALVPGSSYWVTLAQQQLAAS